MTDTIKTLYVEDDLDIQVITEMALADDGFELTICSSGLDAINQAQHNNYDLLLLDVMMPGLDGPSTLRKLRKLDHLKTTPVIFMTAKVQPDEVDSYMKQGALGVIPKPFDPMQLSDTIRDLLCIEKDTADTDSIANTLSQLHSQFTNALPDRIRELKQSLKALDQSDLLASDFYRNVHSLSGSASTFGYIRLGEAAMQLELTLKEFSDNRTFDNVQCQNLLEKIETLASLPADREFSTAAIGTASTRQISRHEQYLIYLLEDDVSLAAETIKQISQFGYHIEGFNTLNEIEAAIEKQLPHAMIIDINLTEGRQAGTEFALKISQAYKDQVTIIFMSGHDTWQDRLSAVRANGQAYISKPVNFEELTELLDRLSGRTESIPFRVLIVDDTELLAEHYASVLSSAGMETRTLYDPSEILNILPDFLPDLILMDLYMPEVSGIETSAIIRQHNAYTNIPIVYLSTEESIQKQLDALRAGGDDFLQKPIQDQHLVESIEVRLRRFVQLNELMTTDGLTGLLNHINLKLTLDRELTTAHRRNSELTFAMIDIDHFKNINDTYGHPVGDRVIKSLARLFKNRLRKSDVAARYGGEEFALILPDTSLQQAKSTLNEIRKIFSELTFKHARGDFHASFSVGLASSQGMDTMQELINAADEALYESKHKGRNCLSIANSKQKK